MNHKRIANIKRISFALQKECRLLAELIMRRRYRNLSDSKPNLLKERKKRKKSE